MPVRLRPAGLALIEEQGGGDRRPPEVQRRFNDELQAELADSSFAGSCNSWYKTATGKITNNWSGSVEDYRAATARLDPEAYDIADAEGGPAEDREPGPASH